MKRASHKARNLDNSSREIPRILFFVSSVARQVSSVMGMSNQVKAQFRVMAIAGELSPRQFVQVS
jgi:hypothetical protein